MRLLELTTQAAAHPGVRLDARITGLHQTESSNVYFEYDAIDPRALADDADAFVPAMLLPAMRAREELRMESPVSAALCFNAPRIRDIFHSWWPELHRSPLQLTPRPDDGTPPARALTFFSGGVDSFYSLLKHRHGLGTLPAPMTHLVFMQGVEARLELTRDDDQSVRWIREIASATGVTPIFGRTNIRTALQGPETNLHWERHYHGSALASIALTLGRGFGYTCIPSAFSYNHLVAHGSTPLVDEMYSTPGTHIVHDGAEVSRATKVARIIDWDRDAVLAHLRVCIRNYGGAFNCGRCYKCVRTAIPLRILGVWPQAATFPNKSSDHWEAGASEDHLALTEENLQMAREYGAERKLIAMLERVVRRRRRLQGTLAVIRNSPLEHLLPVARRLRGLRA